MFDLFGIGKLRERVEENDRVMREALQHLNDDQQQSIRWISQIHKQQQDAIRQPVRVQPLNEQQIVAIVERHAAFDIILDRIRAIESKVNMIARPQLPPPVDTEALAEQVQERIEEQVGSRIASEVATAVEAAQGSVIERLRELAQRVETVESRPVQEKVIHVEKESVERTQFERPQPRTNSMLEQRLLRRIARHPKPVVKSAIYSIVRKYGKIQGNELREMVVEEQRLCSKSSLYRLLAELEEEGSIEALSQGRDKLYVELASSKNRHE